MKLKIKLGNSFNNKSDIKLYKYSLFWYNVNNNLIQNNESKIKELSNDIKEKLNINSYGLRIFVEDILLPQWEDIQFLNDGDTILIEKLLVQTLYESINNSILKMYIDIYIYAYSFK